MTNNRLHLFQPDNFLNGEVQQEAPPAKPIGGLRLFLIVIGLQLMFLIGFLLGRI